MQPITTLLGLPSTAASRCAAADAGARCAWRRRSRGNCRSDHLLSRKEGRSWIRRNLTRNAYTDAFVKFMGGGYADAVATGTASLYIAVAALELPAGSEVIVSPVTDPGSLVVDHSQSAGASRSPTASPAPSTWAPSNSSPGSRRRPAPSCSCTRSAAPPTVERCGKGSARARHSRDRGLQPVAWRPRQRPADRQFRRHRRVLNHVPQGAYDRRRRRRGVYRRDIDLHHRALAHADRGKPSWRTISTIAIRTNFCFRRSIFTPTKSPARSAFRSLAATTRHAVESADICRRIERPT